MPEWKPIPDWPYEVSEAGEVRNARTGHVLKQRLHASGYIVVQLWNQMSYWTVGVHQLVAVAFIGAKPSEKHEVAHRDGNREHNHRANLKWATKKENMADRDRHGTTAISLRNGKTKFTDEQVAEAKALMREGRSPGAVAKLTGIPKGTLDGYRTGARRAYVP